LLGVARVTRRTASDIARFSSERRAGPPAVALPALVGIADLSAWTPCWLRCTAGVNCAPLRVRLALPGSFA